MRDDLLQGDAFLRRRPQHALQQIHERGREMGEAPMLQQIVQSTHHHTHETGLDPSHSNTQKEASLSDDGTLPARDDDPIARIGGHRRVHGRHPRQTHEEHDAERPNVDLQQLDTPMSREHLGRYICLLAAHAY